MAWDEDVGIYLVDGRAVEVEFGFCTGCWMGKWLCSCLFGVLGLERVD